MLSLQLQQFPVFWGQHYLLLAGSRGGAPTAAPASCDSKLGIKTEESWSSATPREGSCEPRADGQSCDTSSWGGCLCRELRELFVLRFCSRVMLIILIFDPSHSGHKWISVHVLYKRDKKNIEACRRKISKRRRNQCLKLLLLLKFQRTRH